MQLQRHGARFPTSNAGEGYRAAIEKLLSANLSSDPRVAFLKNYTYDLGTDDLVPLGALQYVLPPSHSMLKGSPSRVLGREAFSACGIEKVVSRSVWASLRWSEEREDADDEARSHNLGDKAFKRYSALVDGSDEVHVPFVRASGAARVVDSATNWTAGKLIVVLSV